MTKFHVNQETGDAGECKATKSCPFGSASEHYDTVEEAQVASEKQLEDEYGGAVAAGKSKESAEQVAERVAEAERVANEIDDQRHFHDYDIDDAVASEDGKTITLKLNANGRLDQREFGENRRPEEVDAVLDDNEDFYSLSEEEAEERADELAKQVNENINAAYFSGQDSHAADEAALLIEHHGDKLPEGYDYKVEFSTPYVAYDASDLMDRWELEQDD